MQRTRILTEYLVHPPIELLMAVLITALLLTIAVPGIVQLRERARQHQTDHRFKMLGMAMSNYHDTFQSFPSNVVVQPANPQVSPAANNPATELVSPLLAMPYSVR